MHFSAINRPRRRAIRMSSSGVGSGRSSRCMVMTRGRGRARRASALWGDLEPSLFGVGFERIVDEFRLVSATEQGEAAKPILPVWPDAQGKRFGLRPLLKRRSSHALGLLLGLGLPFPCHRVI